MTKEKTLPATKSMRPIAINATKLEDKILFTLLWSSLNSATNFNIDVPKPKSKLVLKPQIEAKRIQIPKKSFPKCTKFNFRVINEPINRTTYWIDSHKEFFLSENIILQSY